MTKEELKSVIKASGIYCITNTVNGKKYIGQSINIRDRLLTHFRNHVKNRYARRHLYRAFNKYGIENFSFSILEIVNVDMSLDKKNLKKSLNYLEKYYIHKLKSYGAYGYNETKGGESKVGWCPDATVRQKIAKSNKEFARKHNEEIRKLHEQGVWNKDDCYHSLYTYAIHIKTHAEFNGYSRTHVIQQIKEMLGIKLAESSVCGVINGRIKSSKGFVFGNSKQDCLEKLLNLHSYTTLKHSCEFAPNYEMYFKYLTTVCDDRGYLPTNKEIGNHFNRKPSTICGWNNKIREELELDIKYNRLRMKNYSNSAIHYEIPLSPIYNGNNF